MWLKKERKLRGKKHYMAISVSELKVQKHFPGYLKWYLLQFNPSPFSHGTTAFNVRYSCQLPPTLSPFFCCLKVYYILVTTIQYITLLTRNTLFPSFKTMGTLFLFCCNICISAFPFHVVFDLKGPKVISLRHNLIKAQDQDTV